MKRCPEDQWHYFCHLSPWHLSPQKQRGPKGTKWQMRGPFCASWLGKWSNCSLISLDDFSSSTSLLSFAWCTLAPWSTSFLFGLFLVPKLEEPTKRNSAGEKITSFEWIKLGHYFVPPTGSSSGPKEPAAEKGDQSASPKRVVLLVAKFGFACIEKFNRGTRLLFWCEVPPKFTTAASAKWMMKHPDANGFCERTHQKFAKLFSSNQVTPVAENYFSLPNNERNHLKKGFHINLLKNCATRASKC